MSVFINLLWVGQLYVEFATWARPDRLFHARVEGRELFIWLGRLHLIYTPPSWTPALREWRDGNQRGYVRQRGFGG
ncbi:MAG TPA: hypothetical protein VEH84_04170 [Alphaproteobacteria bacterium]|nr:hypothetical protein [Alphaproteobacteria bacterium]